MNTEVIRKYRHEMEYQLASVDASITWFTRAAREAPPLIRKDFERAAEVLETKKHEVHVAFQAIDFDCKESWEIEKRRLEHALKGLQEAFQQICNEPTS